MDALKILPDINIVLDAKDGINKTRKLITFFAISGKLTSQETGEDASSLLSECKKTNNNKLTTKKTISPPWKIPKSWQWVRLGEVCTFRPGRTPSRKESKYWTKAEHSWMSIADLQHGKTVTKSKEKISDIAKTEVFKSPPSPAGSLLMSFKLSIGKISMLGAPSYHNEAIVTITPFSEKLTPYFFKCLAGFDLTAENKSAIKGKTLNQESLYNIQISIPPENEIPRIVAKVDKLMALCDRLEQLQQTRRTLQNSLRQATLQAVVDATTPDERQSTWIRLSDNFEQLFQGPEDVGQLRASILDLAVRGYLVEQAKSDEQVDSWLEHVTALKTSLARQKAIPKQTTITEVRVDDYPFPLPQGWMFVRLGKITNKIGSGSTPRGGREVYVKEGIPFLRSQNIWNDGLHLKDVACITNKEHLRMSGTAVQPNDLLLNITGASLGRCALVPNGFENANVSQHVCIIRLTDPSIREYVHLCMLSPYVQSMIWGRQVGMAREGLSKKVLEQFELPLPPVLEQRRIVAQVAKLMRICDIMEEQLVRSKQLSERLLATAIAGITGATADIKEEPMKAPQTELIANLRLGSAPGTKAHAPLSTILARHNGMMSARDLCQNFGGEIDAFYAQLKVEVSRGWILEPAPAEILEKPVETVSA